MSDLTISDPQLLEELAVLRTRVKSLEQEQEKRQITAERLDRITQCFLGFTTDPEENFNQLTTLAGDLLGADCALYNRLERGLLCSLGQWSTPPDYSPVDRPQGHICYDIIQRGGEDVFVIRDLQNTRYAESDPNVRPYELQTYIGKAVRCNAGYVGSLCVVYQRDVEPTDEDKQLLTLLASALGVEEERRQTERALRKAHDDLEQRVERRTEELSRTVGVLKNEIKDREQAEEDLRGLKEFNESIVHHMFEGIVVEGADGTVIFTNPAAAEMLGYTWNELLGMHWTSLVPPDQHAIVHAANDRRRQNKSDRYELTMLRRDGSRISLLVAGSPRFQGNHFNGTTVVFTDITERKRSEQLLQDLNDDLEQRVAERTAELAAVNEHLQMLSQAKDEFIANVSHELRTPIANLKLYHHLLVSHPAKQESYIATLERETLRLERLVEDLLYLSELDRQEIRFRFDTLDINALVSTFVADRLALSAERGLTLDFKPDPTLPTLPGDAALLERVLSSLVTNSLDYTPAGGCVSVGTALRQRAGQRWVVIRVSDTGPGMPSEERGQVFTRFFRGKAALDSGMPGAGLGLSIAKEIVDRHQGMIEICDPERGVGITFCIWLPVDRQPPPPPGLIYPIR
jgi:PAS domain S-box-containing protein